MGDLVAFVQLYLLCTYLVGYCGRDFDPKQHRRIVEENSYAVTTLLLTFIFLVAESLSRFSRTRTSMSRNYITPISRSGYSTMVVSSPSSDLQPIMAFEYITGTQRFAEQYGDLSYSIPDNG